MKINPISDHFLKPEPKGVNRKIVVFTLLKKHQTSSELKIYLLKPPRQIAMSNEMPVSFTYTPFCILQLKCNLCLAWGNITLLYGLTSVTLNTLLRSSPNCQK